MKVKENTLQIAVNDVHVLAVLIRHFQYSINDIKSYDELTETEKTIISKKVFDQITE